MGGIMKKLLLGIATLTTIAAAPAVAADMPVKAVPVYEHHYSWTGCYVGAGGGYGMWTQNHYERLLTGVTDSFNSTSGGKGGFGTVQGGCDYQAGGSWVFGAFADYDFASIRGDHNLSIGTFPYVASEKERASWAAGGRLGWVPYEKLMVFVSGGYTQARFDAYDPRLNFAPGFPPTFHVNSTTRHGYFIGSGYEYVLGWFPGLTWKTEYRFADYGSQSDTVFLFGTVTPFRETVSHKYVQTLRTELVWRWGGGSVRAAY